MSGLSRRLTALADRIAGMPRVLLLLDFDGTLAPIRSRPELANIDDAMRAVLARLGEGRMRLMVISGRSLRDLKAKVALPRIGYGGVFGLELCEPGWRMVQPHALAVRPALAGVQRELEEIFADFPGVRVEDKGVGLALHYRAVPKERRAAFSRRLARARTMAPPGLVWRRGQRDWEVTPRGAWDKGHAAMTLWRRHGKPTLVAIGDDAFDEPMFRAVRGRGAAIRVGTGPSCAPYRLQDPERVALFLCALAERVAGRAALARAHRAPSGAKPHKTVTPPRWAGRRRAAKIKP